MTPLKSVKVWNFTPVTPYGKAYFHVWYAALKCLITLTT
jgi:hypothetical protein